MNKKFIIFADNYVGTNLISWITKNYRNDISMVFTLNSNEINEICNKFNISNAVFENEDTSIDLLNKKNLETDLGFLFWWPKLISKKLLSIPKKGFINTHPSYLPHSRGKNYNFWTIVENAPFGVSLHFVEEGIDCGDIVAQKQIHYDWEDNGGTLFKKSRDTMIELFKDSYGDIRNFKFSLKKQNLSKGSFHYEKEMHDASIIDLNKNFTAKELLNLLRARTMDGYPGCYFYEDSNKYEINISINKLKD